VLEPAERIDGRHSLDLHPVDLLEAVAGIGDRGPQLAIVGQQQQALAVEVEPAGGVDAGQRQVVGERRAPVRVGKAR